MVLVIYLLVINSEFDKSLYKMYNIDNQLISLFTEINNIKEPYN